MATKRDYPLRRYLQKQVFEEWEDDPKVLIFEGRVEFFMNKATSKEIQITTNTRLPEQDVAKCDFMKVDIFSADGIWDNYLADGYREVDKEGRPVVGDLKRVRKSRFKSENERLERKYKEGLLSQEEAESMQRLESLESAPTKEEEELNARGCDWTGDYEDYIGENSQE